jgi:hypothetical protein
MTKGNMIIKRLEFDLFVDYQLDSTTSTPI